jgi:hypothetical protein
MAQLFFGIAQLRNHNCQLIPVTDTSLRSTLRHIQGGGKGNATALFFDMVAVPHFANKVYEERPWKRKGKMFSCSGELVIKSNVSPNESSH